MHNIAIVFPSLVVIRASVAAVWLYEGLWCKILGRVPSQGEVVATVPRLGPRFGSAFLKTLGVVEVGLSIWVMAGVAPGVCAIVQTALLVVLNANGLLWGRRSRDGRTRQHHKVACSMRVRRLAGLLEEFAEAQHRHAART